MKQRFRILFLASLFLIPTASTGGVLASAASEFTEEGYSSVSEDLNKLDGYDATKPFTENEFITLAQQFDAKNELKTFIYIYKETMYSLTGLNLSLSLPDEEGNIVEDFAIHQAAKSVSYSNLGNGAIYKFEILDLHFEQEIRRIHVVSIILKDRLLQESIAIAVAKEFYFYGDTNETLEGHYKETEVITIRENRVVDYCYGKNLALYEDKKEDVYVSYGTTYNDAWFIFFNTDITMDRLLEVEISYGYFQYCIGGMGDNLNLRWVPSKTYVADWVNNVPTAYQGSAYEGDFYFSDRGTKEVVVEPGTKKVSSSSNGWFGTVNYYYETLENIMDLRSYKAKDEDRFIFTDFANEYTWGVHFLDTKRATEQKGANGVAGLIEGTGLYDVCILRLKFYKDGVLKNLGAVDAPDDPDIVIPVSPPNENWLKRLLDSFLSSLLFILSIFGIIIVVTSLLKRTKVKVVTKK